MFAKRHGKDISPDQLGELSKRFIVEISKRSHAEAQALLEGSIDWHVREMLDEQGNFTCDWVESDLEYPAAYKGLRPVEGQIHMLADEFRMDRKPALKLLEKGLPDLPKWAEAWAALPMQEKFPDSHSGIIYKALIWHSGICGNQPGCYSGYGAPEGLELEEHVRPHFIGPELEKVNCTRRNFARNWERHVGGRIMIVPVQMGALRKGQSDRMVKATCDGKNFSEFPLGIFEVACLLAMHPERVPESDEKALEVNAPGDEYTPEGFIKSGNCRWHQMGEWRRLGKDRLPSFGFARSGKREAHNGPVTASSWNVKAHLKSFED